MITLGVLMVESRNLVKSAHTRCAPSCKISAPYPQRFKSYWQKCSFLTSFKTLAAQLTPFQTICLLSRPLYRLIYWVNRIRRMFEREITRTKFLSRPSYEHRYSFQRLNFREMLNLVHFKTLGFSLITAQWQDS